ncbi:putative Nibrin [Daphnia magna]|uniref:Putative Nibrin n=1 Tax=Daphnia magna TaxID=35525 RepID=A0A164NRX7_9CRUS|nr:putative Nibrin [Daphnia magna]
MWFIQRKSDGQTVYLLNKEYDVGRRKCTIEVSDDLSVSRQHLKLTVDYSPLTQVSGQPTLKIMDLGSTYGVFINPSTTNTGKVEPKTWVNLEADSSFHFGVKNEWIVKWKNISVVCSALGSAERRRLNKELTMLGAESLSEWQHGITHLVTDKIMLTQKVLDSLLAAIPIVVVDFFEKWVSLLEQDSYSPLPDASQYTPQIGPALGQFGKQSFIPKEERKSLFLGKTFLFASSNELKSSMAIAAKRAGGNITSDFEAINTEGVVLMECANSPPDYARLVTSLSSRGERSIPQSEIGLAILSCSVEIYCNPRARLASEHSQGCSKPAKASFQCSFRDEETQLATQPFNHKKESEEPPCKRNKIENPTPESHQVHQPPTKRIHLDDEAAATCEIRPSDKDNDEILKRKSVKPKSGPLCSGRTNVKTEDRVNIMDLSVPQKLHAEFFSRQSSDSSSTLSTNVNPGETSHFQDTRHTTKSEVGKSIPACLPNKARKSFRSNDQKLKAVNQSVVRSAGLELTSTLPSNSQLKSLSRTSLNGTMGNDQSRSQWHGCSSPGKLNTSKLIVKTNLVRPEVFDKSSSQKSQNQLKETQVITRIKSMKIASLKEGKWTTK